MVQHLHHHSHDGLVAIILIFDLIAALLALAIGRLIEENHERIDTYGNR